MKSSDFWTRPKSEEGVRFPLLLQDGRESGHWLVMFGEDSEAFETAVALYGPAVMRARATDDAAAAKFAVKAATVDFLAALIKDWNLEDPFSPEAAREFLWNAPRVARDLDQAVKDVRRFFGPASTASSPGQRSSADSAAAVETNSPNAPAKH